MKFEVNLIYFKTLAALRPRTLFLSFYYTKNRTLTALSNFREFLKNKNSLEPLNVIFRIRSPKGIFGQNMSGLVNGSLTGVSRSLQSAILKDLVEMALRTRKRCSREKIAEDVHVKLRKIPATFEVRWKGRKYFNYEIAVDLTLWIKLGGKWPAASDIRRRLNRGHPCYNFFQEVVSEGYHLVASTTGESIG